MSACVLVQPHSRCRLPNHPTIQLPTLHLNPAIVDARVATAPRIATLKDAESREIGESQIVVRTGFDRPLSGDKVVHHAVNRYRIGREKETVRRLVPERRHHKRLRSRVVWQCQIRMNQRVLDGYANDYSSSAPG